MQQAKSVRLAIGLTNPFKPSRLILDHVLWSRPSKPLYCFVGEPGSRRRRLALHHQPPPACLPTPSSPDATVGLRGSHLPEPASVAARLLAASDGEQSVADVAPVAAGIRINLSNCRL